MFLYRFVNVNNLEPNQRKRALAFSDAEKLALSEAIKDRHEVLFGGLKPDLTFKTKNEAWKDVQEAVHKVSGIKRTVTQLREKYKNMKRETKSFAAHNKRELFKTGGGYADIVVLDPASQAILETIPKAAIQGIDGGVDTSVPRGMYVIIAFSTLFNSLVILLNYVTLALTDLDTRNDTDLDDGYEKLPYLYLAGQEPSTSKSSNAFSLKLTPASLSRPPVSRRDDEGASDNEQRTPLGFQALPTTSGKTPRRKKDIKNPTESLMQEQVKLLQEQGCHLSGIHECLKRLNEIEEEKLELKKKKYINYNYMNI